MRIILNHIIGFVKLFPDRSPPATESKPDPDLSRRLDALLERVERLERTLKAVQLEWDETYDKLRLLYARLSKRLTEAAKLDQETPQEPARASTGPRRMVGDLPEHPEPPGPRRNY